MNEKGIPEEIIRLIEEKEYFILLTHVHPDGDAIGSLLGFADILDGLGKHVFAYLDEPVSHIYDFIPGCSRISDNFEDLRLFLGEAGADVAAIALDCGEADRLGELKNELLKIHPFIVIDHHLSHRNYGDYRWVEPSRSSTGEMIYEISEVLGQTISYHGAFALYVAIVTDTGSFKYECTKARTLEVAGRLLDRGVQPDKVASYLYDNFTPQRFKLMEMVLGTLELHNDDTLALIHVTRSMFEKSGALAQDVEGFIDYPRSLQSVKLAVFLKETKNNVISVSLRAKGECDVAAIAKHFGGGGHRNAAGCRFSDLSLEQVRLQILAYTKSTLASQA